MKQIHHVRLPRRTLVFVLFCCVLFSLIVVFWERTKPQAPPPERVVVRLKWLHQAQYAGLYIAKTRGIYEAAGLDVEFREFDRTLTVSKFDQLLDGTVHLAYTGTGELLDAVNMQKPVRAVSALYQFNPISFASPASAPVTSPADLKGKRLGVAEGGSAAQAIYRALAESHGIPQDSYTFVVFGPDVVRGFQENLADTFVLSRSDQVYALKRANIPYVLLNPERFDIALYDHLLVASEQYIAEHPETIARFVQATREGWEYAIMHPDEAIDATMSFITDPNYKDRAYNEFILQETIPLTKPTALTKIGDMEFIRWQAIVWAMQNAGYLLRDVDPSELYTKKFLRDK